MSGCPICRSNYPPPRRARGHLFNNAFASLSPLFQLARSMKIEGIEIVCVAVDNLDEAVRFYSRLLDTEFQLRETRHKEGTIRWGISPFGLELWERPVKAPGSDTVRSFHFRVPDVEEAREEMRTKGFEPVDELTVAAPKGRLREVIYHIRGLRMILVDYKGKI